LWVWLKFSNVLSATCADYYGDSFFTNPFI